MNKNAQSIKDLWNAIKHANTCLVEVLEGEERKRKRKYLNTGQKDLKLVKNSHLHILEGQ